MVVAVEHAHTQYTRAGPRRLIPGCVCCNSTYGCRQNKTATHGKPKVQVARAHCCLVKCMNMNTSTYVLHQTSTHIHIYLYNEQQVRTFSQWIDSYALARACLLPMVEHLDVHHAFGMEQPTQCWHQQPEVVPGLVLHHRVLPSAWSQGR